MKLIRRGQIWRADLEPQEFKDEPGKIGRPVLVIQSDALNTAGHRTTIIIPGTTKIEGFTPEFPLSIRVQKHGSMSGDTDFLIDSIRAVSNERLLDVMGQVHLNHLKMVEDALKLLILRR